MKGLEQVSNMDKLQFWLYIFYVCPLELSALYFTILKIEDINRQEKVYSKDKFSYRKVLGLCFVPIFNVLIAVNCIKMCFKSIRKGV